MFLCFRLLKRSATLTIVNNKKHIFSTPRNLKPLPPPLHSSRTIAMASKVNKNQRAPPANIDVVVVSGGRRDTGSCLIVTTDYSTYLINCPEGTQRILADVGGSKFSRLEHIFLTTNKWRNGGGLLGLALTLQTAGAKRLAVHGPTNCDKTLVLARNFANDNEGLQLDVESLTFSPGSTDDTLFTDESITVSCIPLIPASSRNNLSKRSKSSFDGCNTALAFVIKPKPKNRRVDMDKCIKLGLPRGPAIGKLVKGDPVTLSDGRIISPDDVLDDPLPARPVLFVDCPNQDYVASLCDNPVTTALQTSFELESQAQLVVHMSPSGVFASKEYQQWLAKFQTDSTNHLVLNENCPFVAHERIYRLQAQLNMLDGRVFKLLDDQLEENAVISNKSSIPDENNGEKQFITGGTGLSYFCRQGVFQGSVKGFPIQLDNQLFCSEVLTGESGENVWLHQSLSKYREFVAKRQSLSLEFPKILFLGTASAVPGKRRNSSAILLILKNEVGKVRHVLVDCAEGTCGQLLRYFGRGKSGDEALAALDVVLLSHRHPDHHMGLLGIVYERHRAFKQLSMAYKPLVVVQPRYEISNWLKSYSSAIDPNVLGQLIHLVDAQRLADEDFTDAVFDQACETAGLGKIVAVPVRHCRNAHGFVVETRREGFHLTYSGDTVPCDNLVRAGLDCDLLIHEATFDDDLADEAVAKRHSTTSEAIEIGRRMKAKSTLLTHFSQRYETLPHLTDELVASPVKHNVGIAFDNMLISAGDLDVLPQMLPVLRHMFAEKLEVLDETKQKRSLKRERELSKLSSMLSSSSEAKK